MANRSDRGSITPRQIKRQIALAEANGEIPNKQRRREVLRILQGAHKHAYEVETGRIQRDEVMPRVKDEPTEETET